MDVVGKGVEVTEQRNQYGGWRRNVGSRDRWI